MIQADAGEDNGNCKIKISDRQFWYSLHEYWV